MTIGPDFHFVQYLRLAFMMLDADVVAVSPSSVYRVLKAAGKLTPRGGKPSRKGKGFEQPLRPHEHRHVDVSYINICGTFFHLCSLLDGYSRFLVHWEIRESMIEQDVQTVVQRAWSASQGARLRIITDNGPQVIAREFKPFIRICGMAHLRTSPYYPHSNGKMERWFKTVRLQDAIGYVPPADKLAGRVKEIWAERKRKLAEAEARRRTAQSQATAAPRP